jgi:hypothetical protein
MTRLAWSLMAGWRHGITLWCNIADDLTASGFAAHSPIWDGSAYLTITNARGALCDLTITTSGTVTWEYRSRHGSHINPDQITGIVLDLLSPGSDPHPTAVSARQHRARRLAAAEHQWRRAVLYPHWDVRDVRHS